MNPRYARLAISLVFASMLSMSILAASIHASPVHAATEPEKAVLVTGASTGLGRAITEDLASRGYYVFAGARKDSDIDALNAIENVQAIRLDVNDQAQIDAAVATVAKAGKGLYGLVNNAGVLVFGPLIEIDESELEFQMNVNVFGVYRVTKAFAPMIIESRGRITNIGSISGTLSSAIWGPYSMTKHAIEAYTDALADELRRFGVQVSVVEPGTYTSKISQSAFSRMQADADDPDASLFGPELEDEIKWAEENLQASGDPSEVAEAVYLSLFEQNPKPRYLVVPDQAQAEITIGRMIERTVEMNADHRYSYSRDELVAMLDAALANEQPASEEQQGPDE
ncbi:MAG: SDR family oxidoreductase [Gammaproteobacteria bacterium]